MNINWLNASLIVFVGFGVLGIFKYFIKLCKGGK